MKKHIYLLFFCCFSILCFSQEGLSKIEMSKMTKIQKKTYHEVKIADSLRSLRLTNFFSKKSTQKRVFTDKITKTKYVIYDVIDNQPIYRALDNNFAAIATGTNHLQVGGTLGLNLDGSNMLIRVWDGGPIQLDHAEFMNASDTASRATNEENLNTEGTTTFDAHANHVSGTIIAKGVSPSAKGMATNGSVKTYNFNNDAFEMVTELGNTTDPMILSNHSYGVPLDQGDGETLDAWYMGAYNIDAREIDGIARSYRKYLIVTSAGNAGTDTYTGGMYQGYDKLTTDKNAKNNLVIANASPTVAIPSENVTFTNNPSSSQGPTDDLRIKPDISGDGTGLFSPIPTDSYAIYSGTSMASPNVTGSLALLQQYYNQLHNEFMNSSTLKGLVCHSAKDDTSTIGPDPIFGWGLLDAEKAAEIITANEIGSALIEENSLNNNDTYTINFSAVAGQKLSATICWTDLKGVPASGSGDLNNQMPRLINDLDITLTQGGNIYYPWRLEYSPTSGFSNSKGDNIRDNIERIDLDVPVTGDYTLTVSHKGTIQIDVPGAEIKQDYSLILTGNDLVLGVDENELLNQVKVFPNPNNGEFTISINSQLSMDNMSIEIYDISGRKIMVREIKNYSQRQLINIGDSVSPGVYLMNIYLDNRKFTQKLIVK